MDWKEFGSSGPGLIIRDYCDTRLEGLRKTTKTSIIIASRRGPESSPGPPEYEAVVLTTRPRRRYHVLTLTYISTLDNDMK
jgi:hypothetical protein